MEAVFLMDVDSALGDVILYRFGFRLLGIDQAQCLAQVGYAVHELLGSGLDIAIGHFMSTQVETVSAIAGTVKAATNATAAIIIVTNFFICKILPY